MGGYLARTGNGPPGWKNPYAAYVLQRRQEGIHEAKQLYEEIQAQGFPVTLRIVQCFVQALRDDLEKIALAPATAAERFSANAATWLFIRDPAQLTAEKQGELELICQRSETACLTYAFDPTVSDHTSLPSWSGI